MALEWIIMQHDLPGKPKTKKIGRLTGASDPALTLGRLFLVWTWADKQSEDGVIRGVELADIDDEAGCEGFADAMIQVGWLVKDGDLISFPGFGDHNGQTAKTRAKESLKKQRQRRSKGTGGGQVSPECPPKAGQTGDASGTIQNKTKQNTSPSEKKGDASASRAAEFDWDRDCPPNLNTPAVRDAMDDWFEYRRERKLAKWKPSTIKKQLAAFADDGPTAFVAAVDHSIRQQYQGLFAPSGGTARASPGTRLNDQHTIKSDDDPLDRLMRNAREAG